jgi:hypothetical protein
MSGSIGDGMAAFALAGGIVGYVWVTHRTRQRRLEMIHQERMAAMEKGIPLPEFPLEVERQESRPNEEVLPILGIVLSTLALGAMVVLYLNLPAASHSFWVAPLPFAFLGVGLTAFHYLTGSGRSR